MDKKQKNLWIIIHMIVFLLPIIICVLLTPYQISYDREYVNTVGVRVFEPTGEGKMTDFTEAKRMEYDSEGTYIRKEWKLKNKEIYYFENILCGVVIGVILQILLIGLFDDDY